MKYLKTFESKNINKDNIKKYSIWYWYNIGDYDIIEKKEILDDKFWSKNIYCYDKSENRLSIADDFVENFSYVDDLDEYIIFTSDNLDECKDKLEQIILANKYNIG